MALVLRQLNQTDERAFLEGAKSWAGENSDWYSFVWRPEMSFQDMLKILEREAAGIDLAPGRVPHSMLYAFWDGEIVGRLSVRHTLNDSLRKRGGHIGYAVAPKYRKKGYATEIVRQGLDFCKSLGISKVMVSCSDDNVPSWKIIEKFNGQLEDKVWDEQAKEMIRRYWISL